MRYSVGWPIPLLIIFKWTNTKFRCVYMCTYEDYEWVKVNGFRFVYSSAITRADPFPPIACQHRIRKDTILYARIYNYTRIYKCIYTQTYLCERVCKSTTARSIRPSFDGPAICSLSRYQKRVGNSSDPRTFASYTNVSRIYKLNVSLFFSCFFSFFTEEIRKLYIK